MAMAKFLLNWKVGLSQFQPNTWKTKTYVVAHNNVSFQWTTGLMLRGNGSTAFNFSFSHSDGPVLQVEHASYTVSVIKPDGAVTRIGSMGGNGSQAKRGELYSSIILNSVTNHLQGNEVFFQIELQMPTVRFSCSYAFPPIEPAQSWLRDLFGKIENPNNGYDTILIGSDGVTRFYVHKFVLLGQSDVLAATLRSPQEQNGVYRFPTLTKGALKSLLQYLYTGERKLNDLSVIDIIAVANAAGRYGLEKLYLCCYASLWKRVVDEPGKSMQVVCYANVPRLKYLKHRAMDVLAENVDEIPLTSQQFGGDQLMAEFAQYCARRVTVSSLAN